MTDILRTALNMAYNDDDIPFDKQILIDWMDDKVDAVEKVIEIINDSPADCPLGNLVDGDYEFGVETCGWGRIIRREIFIFKGIKILADAVGAELKKETFLEDREKYSFSYRNMEFFQLRTIGEELR